MTALSPRQAAEIARGVYALRHEANLLEAYELGGGLGIATTFSIDGAVRLTASAGPGTTAKSGFGLVAHGTGVRRGELLVAMRGTAVLRDWLTDARGGLQSGPRGHLVHAGFNETFKSLREQLHAAVAGVHPTAIHCVGHSLGGALAALAADSFAAEGFRNLHLYTFGSPRVGLRPFASDLTRTIRAERIHRVYHDADPVSMIPLFPYSHVPERGRDLRLAWSGGLVCPAAHTMDTYIASIGEAAWDGLAQPSLDPLGESVRAWFDGAMPRALMLSSSAFWTITDALAWLIRKIAVVVVGTTFVVGATLLDRLAWILWQGALASRAIAADAEILMRRILQFLGRGLQAGVSLSVAFVRWVLDLLLSAVSGAATLAVEFATHQ